MARIPSEDLMSVDLSMLNEEQDQMTSSRSTINERIEEESETSPQFLQESPMRIELEKAEGELKESYKNFMQTFKEA